MPYPATFATDHRTIDGGVLDLALATPIWSTPGTPMAAKLSGTQANSPMVTETITAISATAAGGVLLPRPLPGRVVILQNTSNYTVTVFAVDGAFVDGHTGVAGYGLAPLTTMVLAGQNGNVWDVLFQSPIAAGSRYYGSFYSDASQTNLVSVNKMTVNNIVSSFGFSVQSNSQIVAAYTGFYNIQFSAQISKTGANDTIDIWLMKNNQNVDWSDTSVYIQTSSQKFVAAWNWMIPMNAGDYVEVAWNSALSTMGLLAQAASAPMPAIPSVIITVQSV